MRSRRAEWVERVERWRRSGLTAKRFAASIGVNAGTLTHWAWQLGDAKRTRGAMAPMSAAATVPLVEIVGNMPDDDRFELILGDGRRLRIAPRFDAAALQRLLAVLEGRR